MKNYLQQHIELIFFVLLFLLGLSIYSQGLSGDFFILDDLFTLPKLPILNTWDSLWLSLHGNETGILKRPVSIFILSFIKSISNNNAIYFKLANWLLHSMNAVLVYILFKQLFLIPRFNAKAINHKQANIVLLGVCLWYCHPLLVSTVLYPVQLMTILASFFMLLAVNFYLYVRFNYCFFSFFQTLILVCFILLAIFSKEIGVLLFLHFFLLEKLILKNQFKTKPSIWSQRLFITIPLLIGGIAFISILPQIMQGYASRDYSIDERLALQSIVVAHYIKQILVPNLMELSLFQDFWTLDRLMPITIWVNTCLLISTLACAWFFRKKVPLLSYGIFFFFVSHLLESTIIPLEIAFEHRNYLASLGIIMAIMTIMSSSKIPHYLSILALLIYLLALISLTTLRASEWHDEFTFYSLLYQKNPKSLRVADAYAQVLFLSGKTDEGIGVYKTLKNKTNNGVYDLKTVKLICLRSSKKPELFLKKEKIQYNQYDQSLSQVLFELFKQVYTHKCSIDYSLLINYHNELLRHPQVTTQINNLMVIKLLIARYYWLNKQKQLSIASYKASLSMGNIDAGIELLSIYHLDKMDMELKELIVALKQLKPKMDLHKKNIFEEQLNMILNR